MKKMMKRLLAFVAAFAMVFTLNVSAFAEVNVPKESDRATITVKGVEAGATVNAYKIVQGNYTSAGLTNYTAVIPDSIADVTKPTTDELADLAKEATKKDGSKLTAIPMDEGTDSNYTASVGAGSYLVLVTGTSKIYNPMIVSASYDSNSEIKGGSVNAGEKVNTQLVGGTAYAKSEDNPSVDKNIVTNKDDLKGSKGDDVQIGDSVTYQIDGVIPSYSEQYESATYTITDTYDGGLNKPENIKVYIGAVDDEHEISATYDVDGETKTRYTITNTYEGWEDGKTRTLTVAFDSEYILSLADKDDTNRHVYITYDSEVNTHATVNFKPNDNNVTLTYSHTPKETTTTKEITTHHYTFGIDTNINGSGTKTTHEVTKIYDKSTTETVDKGPLEGAEFTLYNPDGTEFGTATSDANGHIEFKGLDADKVYKLKETQAPSGYTGDTTEHTVQILATYKTDSSGELESYTVIIDGKETGTSFTYTNNATTKPEDGIVDNGEGVLDDNTVLISNTPIPGLPSTGGIGTTLFTIGGVTLMAVAVALLAVIMKKRKMAE